MFKRKKWNTPQFAICLGSFTNNFSDPSVRHHFLEDALDDLHARAVELVVLEHLEVQRLSLRRLEAREVDVEILLAVLDMRHPRIALRVGDLLHSLLVLGRAKHGRRQNALAVRRPCVG